MADTADIPSDIEQAATRFAGKYLAHDISCERLYRDVAALVMAERERCAKIAQRRADLAKTLAPQAVFAMLDALPDAIRQQGQP
jgi:hypothetical protein